jgi:hypothetical protein
MTDENYILLNVAELSMTNTCNKIYYVFQLIIVNSSMNRILSVAKA